MQAPHERPFEQPLYFRVHAIVFPTVGCAELFADSMGRGYLRLNLRSADVAGWKDL